MAKSKHSKLPNSIWVESLEGAFLSIRWEGKHLQGEVGSTEAALKSCHSCFAAMRQILRVMKVQQETERKIPLRKERRFMASLNKVIERELNKDTELRYTPNRLQQ